MHNKYGVRSTPVNTTDSTEPSSNILSSIAVAKLFLVLNDDKLSISTNNVNEDAVETFIFEDFAIPILTGPSVEIPIMFKSENSLYPDGCIKDFTGSFHLSYEISLFIAYENF